MIGDDTLLLEVHFVVRIYNNIFIICIHFIKCVISHDVVKFVSCGFYAYIKSTSPASCVKMAPRCVRD